MFRIFNIFIASLFIAALFGQASAQMARNPKLSQQDFSKAQSQAREAGGQDATLVYAARLDLIQRGSYDSLIVIYSKPSTSGKDFFAFVHRDDKRLPVAFDNEGRALKSGDSFYRIGLKHGDGQYPLLRLMGSFSDKSKGELIRNLDFRFNGTEFTLQGQSVFPMPK